MNEMDLESIAEVLRGNSAAFRKLVERYEPMIRHLAVKYLCNRDDALDATQEIFIKAFRALGTFDLSRRFHPWLYSIAVNHLRSVYRRRKNILDVEHPLLSPVEDDREGPQQTLLDRSVEREIQMAVHSLPQSLREVVVLYYFQDLTVAEIQEILDVGKENVKSRLLRARRRLKKLLDYDATDKPK